METTIKHTNIYFSEKIRELIFDIITFLFIILFVYTAASKIITFSEFVNVLRHSPLLGKVNLLVAYSIPSVEILLSVVLIVNKTKKIGLVLSLILMVIFTIYLIYMVSLGGKLPCMCGGVISMFTWKQHIWFNILFILIAISGLMIQKKNKVLLPKK